MNATSDEKPSVKPHKVRYPCKPCAGDHLLLNCLDIPQTLEEGSSRSHHPVSSTSGDHVGDTPSTSGSKVHGKKGNVKFPCRLCEGNHPIHLCPYLDEAKKVLDNCPTVEHQKRYVIATYFSIFSLIHTFFTF